jgi:hypothetical protein
LIAHKRYKLKLNATQVLAELTEIRQVLDASDLSSMNKTCGDRHDVAECVFETVKPMAFDLPSEPCAASSSEKPLFLITASDIPAIRRQYSPRNGFKHLSSISTFYAGQKPR